MTASDSGAPPTRWEMGGGGSHGYTARFLELIATGGDVAGEARLADAMAPRGARILDAGSGLGRTGGALVHRGHRVVAVEKDADLVAHSRRLFPELPVIETDILELTPSLLEEAGAPPEYDLVVLVGNVLVLMAPETEVAALTLLRDLLARDGRILVGFHPVGGPSHVAADYPFADFDRDVRAAGLTVAHRFGSYELHPPTDDYVVAILQAHP